jgi:hypothetical protein
MRKFANIARRVFGNSVQASYFERFHWSILIFWTLQTAEHAALSIWSCDSPDFLITPDIRILGTGADTLNSVQASYFERFHWPILNFWTLHTVEHDAFTKCFKIVDGKAS